LTPRAPEVRLVRVKRLCVFCGSSFGLDPLYAQAARQLGEAMHARGLGLVYGGAHVGLMGVIADALMQCGGEVIGVIPSTLVDREVAHRGLSQLIVVSSMHERKATLASHADAFLALPGGFGTLDELMEIVTWALLGLHAKPIGLLDVGGYFRGLLEFIEHMTRSGFVRAADAQRLQVSQEPADLLDRLFGN
jgi:uncharacterized protein (TIGR00730 family)